MLKYKQLNSSFIQPRVWAHVLLSMQAYTSE